MIYQKKHYYLFLGLLILAAIGTVAAEVPIERFALYVASSTGGNGRDVLRYAESDAQKVSSAMQEIGGIRQENSLTLIDPVKKDLDKAFDTFKKQIADKKSTARRTEFVFYYSGHSDEESLLLGKEEYSYPQLKKSLTAVNADVEVVMLDSCYSGNFVRTKGGSREKPFLFDDSTIVKGHAYLSSSSEYEASQEADSIQSSYFTYALVSGMRGAADSTGDGRVSLNELYHYAFNDTLARTEFSKAGPQHPSYNITLVGSGDLVLTDVSQAESSFILGGASEGRFFVRNAAGILIAEVNKLPGADVALAVPAGDYVISIVTTDTTAQKSISVKKGEHILIDGTDFSLVARTESVSRGGQTEIEAERNAESNEPLPAFLNIGFWPGFGLNLVSKSPDALVSFNIFAAKQRNIYGFQLSSFANIVTENMNGVQINGFFNSVKESMRGVQVSGLINLAGPESFGVQVGGLLNVNSGSFYGIQVGGLLNVATGQSGAIQTAGLVNVSAKSLAGAQVAGLVNYSGGTLSGLQIGGLLNIANKVNGLQIGIFNFAKEVNGASIGLFNFILDGVMSPAVYVDSNKNLYAQYQGGTNWFYTLYYVGTSWDFSGEYVIMGAGVGARLPLGKLFSFDFDVSAKNYTTLKNNIPVKIVTSRKDLYRTIPVLPSFRVSFNFSPFKHFSIFGGAAMDLDFTNCVPASAASSMRFGNNTVTAHPSFFAGIKF